MKSMKSVVRIFVIQMIFTDLRVILVTALQENMQEGMLGWVGVKCNKTKMVKTSLCLSTLVSCDSKSSLLFHGNTRRDMLGTFDICHLGSSDYNMGWKDAALLTYIFTGWNHAYITHWVFYMDWYCAASISTKYNPGCNRYETWQSKYCKISWYPVIHLNNVVQFKQDIHPHR